MTRRRCTALLVAVLLLTLLSPGAAVSSAQQPAVGSGPAVVVVGLAGLQWDDVGESTPVLAELARSGAVGVLSVKALPGLTCRADGWLTLGAGARAGTARPADPPCSSDLPTDLDREAAHNADTRDGAVLGALARALDGRVAVEGAGAELAVGPAGPREGEAPVRLVDAGTLSDGPRRTAELRAADRVIGDVLDSLPGGTDVLVVGLSAGAGSDEPSLHVALARGPSFPQGALRSASTRRTPYVQLIDVAPTVLDLLDRPVPEVMDGQPWQVTGTAPTVDELVDLGRRAAVQREVTVPFFVTAYATVLVLITLALWRRQERAAEAVGLAGTAALGASYLGGLVPWWRAGLPLLALLAIVAALSATVAAVALRVGRAPAGPARPAGIVCAFVALVIVVDLLTGARLQLDSPAGYSSLVAGRFAGLGNVAFGVLAASVLLAAAVLARRGVALGTVAVVVVSAVGAPAWGSDVGGVLALVPAFVLLGVLRAGRPVSLLRLALSGLAGAAVVAAFALLDLTRPEQDRTHLGRFAEDLADGTAGELLARKAAAVLDLLFANAVTALLPLLVAGVVYLVARPPDPLRHAFELAPVWRQGLLALGLACLIGFAVNDSGAAVPALAVCVALPATLAVVLRARRSAPAGASAPGRTTSPVA
jgi:hypothetical protein